MNPVLAAGCCSRIVVGARGEDHPPERSLREARFEVVSA
jgi:hypothetical protein